MTLHDRREIERHVDLRWYRDEDAARRPDVLEALLPEGSVIESEEELEDLHATLLALSHPGLATQALARDALARALAERLSERMSSEFLTTALAGWLVADPRVRELGIQRELEHP